MAVFAYKCGIRSYHINPIMEEVGECCRLFSIEFDKKMFKDFKRNSTPFT